MASDQTESQHTAAKRAPDPDFPHRYSAARAQEFELNWQRVWEERHTFRTLNPGETGFDASRPKFFCMDMFPYPSGAGLHVGHPEGYTATDIICRYRRMKGFNVLHPMGWDAFGLPAEQYAIQTGVHPAITTRKAIDNFRRQLKRFGFCYEWSREFATIDEDYYRWTQWIFLQIYNSWYDREQDKARPISDLIALMEKARHGVGPSGEIVPLGVSAAASPMTGEPVGVRLWHELTQDERRLFIDNHRLAYIDEQTVNWCPKLGTALANEEVKDGVSERGQFPVFRKPLKQWLFRITAYAERLLKDLDGLDWPTSTRTLQTEWIGRSEGADIDFALADPIGEHQSVRVFTTRPDTIFGATFLVVAPEHPLVERILSAPLPMTDADALRAYAQAARNRADVDRQQATKKTGVFTGAYAVNPANGENIPIWTADYVLAGYGHGAIMAVPGHDQRDYDFANEVGLPIRDVVHSRIPAAMLFYSRNAILSEVDTGRWRDVLADFMGLVTSTSTTPPEFPAAIDRVRKNTRAADACAIDGTNDQGIEKRGSIKGEWTGMLDSIGIQDFHEFRDLFAAANFYRAYGQAYELPGYACNSSNEDVSFDDLPTDRAKERAIEWLEQKGIGRRRIQYKLRDWLFSRQRYWGEPFPIVFGPDGNHYPVSESALPVRLPELKDYQPVESDEPRPLLAKANTWVQTTAGHAGVDPSVLPPGTPVRRETNTMPGWAGSCWYYLRYCDPKNGSRFCSAQSERYWMGNGGVDLYIGGAEHAVLHLLYARFWHKVLFDLGHVTTREPFRKLFHQGLITSFSYQRPNKTLVPTDEVDEVSEGKFIERATGQPVTQVIAKMSKSLKNVVNPDDVIAEFGADTFRLYEMYMGPLAASKPWNPRDIVGCFRFLQRAWRLCVDEKTGGVRTVPAPDDALERHLHRTIAKVGKDIDDLSFNTAIAAMIEFVNAAGSSAGITADQADRFARCLAPFAPHLAEELWSRLGRTGLITDAPWPSYDEAKLRDESIEIPVQVQGKLRGKIVVAAASDAKSVEAAALADPKIQEYIAGKPVKKVIVVPGRMVNVIV